MKHGSLFSGIGGFDLAAEWMGWENVFHCEWNPFGQKILKHYWPNAKSYTDITKTDFSIHRGHIDIISGGFPCQPYSTAGKRLGKADDRHLWPEMLRAIREVQPTYIVGENVRGLVNWNGGMVFDEVQSELETEGYEVTSFILPASAINAPHHRERIYFIAHTNKELLHASIPQNGNAKIGNFNKEEWSESWSKFKLVAGFGHSDIGFTFGKSIEPTIVSRYDGIPFGLDNIAISDWIDNSLQAYGNAVVPQIVYQIFKALEKTNP